MIAATARPAVISAVTSLLTAAQFASAAVVQAWVQGYNGPAKGNDYGQAVAVDGSGNVIVTGYVSDNTGRYDCYTAKYSAASGILQWGRPYDGPAGGNDWIEALAVDASGDVIVTGASENGAPDYDTDFYTAKYSSTSGALLWEKRYGSPGHRGDGAVAVAVDIRGDVIVTGSAAGNFYTAKYAGADGALRWEAAYSGPANDAPTGLDLDANGNVFVTGYSWNGANIDYYTAKYAATDGSLLWERRYDGGVDDDAAAAVAVDGDGNVVVTGYSFGDGSSADYYTVKYAAADGARLWESRYNGPTNAFDAAEAVAVDSRNNVVVTGHTKNGDRGDYYTAKYAASDGALLWEKRFGVRKRHDQAKAVAVDADDNVIVTGSSYGATDYDFHTIKYAAASGNVVWEKRYNGAAGAEDRVNGSRSLALGSNGMVVVTGFASRSVDPYVNLDFATVAYTEVLPALSLQVIPTGIRLLLDGTPGGTFLIQRAPAPSGPWTSIASPVASISGRVECLDTNRPPGPSFYRASTP
jgi:uncharacterized delta-60 repeat protein